MNALQIRKEVIRVYAGKCTNTAWEQKVNKMTDNQVTAVYLNLKKRGKL